MNLGKFTSHVLLDGIIYNNYIVRGARQAIFRGNLFSIFGEKDTKFFRRKKIMSYLCMYAFFREHVRKTKALKIKAAIPGGLFVSCANQKIFKCKGPRKLMFFFTYSLKKSINLSILKDRNSIDNQQTQADYSTRVIAYIAWGETVRSKDGIGVKKRGKPSFGEPSTLVLTGNTIRSCSNLQDSVLLNRLSLFYLGNILHMLFIFLL